MATTNWLEDPIEEFAAMSVAERGQARLRRFKALASAENASSLAAMIIQNPTMSPDLAVGASVIAGMPAEDPLAAQAAAMEQEQVGFIGGVWNQTIDYTKNAVRWGTLAFEGIWDEASQRPFRSVNEASKSGTLWDAPFDFAPESGGIMDFSESVKDSYSASGDAFGGQFGEALAQQYGWGGQEARPANIGEGWLAESEISGSLQNEMARIGQHAQIIAEGSDTERQRIYDFYAKEYNLAFQLEFLSTAQQAQMFSTDMNERLMDAMDDESKATKMGWEDAYNSQQQFGTAITHRQRAEENNATMNLKMPWHGKGQHNYTGVSVGRIYASTVTEPGTRPFHLTSGAIDFGWNIAADPFNVAGAGVGKVVKGVRTIGVADEGAKLFKAAAQVDEITTGIRTLEGAPAYRQFNELGAAGKREWRRKASQNLGAESTRFTQYEAGQAGAQHLKLTQELSDLQNTGVFQKLKNTADQFDVKPDVGTATPAGSMYEKAAARIATIEDQAKGVRGQLGELADTTEYKKYKSWSKTQQEDALKLAADPDYDPKLFKAKAEKQRIAREAVRTAEKIRRKTSELGGIADQRGLAERIRTNAGVQLGNNPRIDSGKLGNYLTSPAAKPLVRNLFKAAQDKDLAKIDRILGRSKTPMPRALRGKIRAANDEADVIAALMQHMGETHQLGTITDVLGGGVMNRMVSQLDQRMLSQAKQFNGVIPKVTPRYWGSKVKRALMEQSPHSIDFSNMDEAYVSLANFSEQVGWTRGDDILEGHLEAFNKLNDGDFDGAYLAVSNYSTDLLKHLGKVDMPDNVANHIAKVFRDGIEDGKYFTNRLGDPVDGLKGFENTIMLADGTPVAAPGMHVLGEAWSGVMHMPEPNMVRRAAADMDFLGKITNALTTTGAKNLFDERAWLRFTNSAISRVWKPFVLLRLAWPFKVVGEEQFRMAASSYDTVFTHPLSHISHRLAMKSDEALDVVGDVITEASRFQASQASRVSHQGDAATRGVNHWTTVELPRNADGSIARGTKEYKLYRDSLVKEIDQMWSDPIVHQLFEGGANSSDRVGATVDWLQNHPSGQQIVTRLKAHVRGDQNILAKLDSPEGLRSYVESVNARAHMKAGGHFRREMPDGSWIDDMGVEAPKGTNKNPPNEARYIITKPGLDEIVDVYAGGKFGGRGVRQHMTENILTDVNKAMDDLIEASSDRLPTRVKGYVQPDMNSYDRVVERMFDILMSRRTNNLSRSPVFLQAYWEKLGDMSHMMDDATRAAAFKGVDGANLRAARRYFNDARTKSAGFFPEGGVGAISDIKQADELAKSHALWAVQDLLFDVSKRRNITAALSVIAPFADAWVEVMSTWAKVMARTNGKPLRRLDQFTQGARDNDPFDHSSSWTNKGFIYESNCRDVFAVPVLGSLYNALADVDARWEMSTEGLSIMDFLPGMGPVIQMAVQPLIPDHPRYQWLRNFVAPFGASSLQASVVPTTWQKLLGSWDKSRKAFSDPEVERTYQWAVIDTLRAMEREDPDGFRADMMEDPNLVLEKARGKASKLFVVQGLARFVGPASPSMQPVMEDQNGQVWATAMLSDEFYQLMDDNNGDKVAAVEQWIELFNYDPYVLGGFDENGDPIADSSFITAQAQGKSITIEKRGTSTLAMRFEKDNPELFAKYGEVAYYFGPAYLEDASEFHYPAYHRSLASDARADLTAEQWLEMAEDTKGKIAYDSFQRRQSEGVMKELGVPEGLYDEVRLALGGDEEAWTTLVTDPKSRAALRRQYDRERREYKNYLKERFPGYTGTGDTPAGVPARTTIDSQIVKLRQALAETDLAETNEAAYAAQQYLNYKDEFDAITQNSELDWGIANVNSAGNAQSTSESGVFAYAARAQLRQKAQDLMVQYPEFAPMWEDIFSRQLADDRQQEPTLEDAYRTVGGLNE